MGRWLAKWMLKLVQPACTDSIGLDVFVSSEYATDLFRFKGLAGVAWIRGIVWMQFRVHLEICWSKDRSEKWKGGD